jgi:hypothetical protein
MMPDINKLIDLELSKVVLNCRQKLFVMLNSNQRATRRS